MNVLALQFDIAWENKEANFTTVRAMLQLERPPADSLVVLPEMFATGFSMNAEAIAEPYGGPTEQFLAALATEFNVWVLAGVAARGRDGHYRNKALAISPTGELAGFYAKMRPFTPGGEGQHYTAGKQPTAFHWGDCAVSPFICYDLRFPELFRRVAAAHRPELFAVIANWPEKRSAHWLPLLRARAIENQAYVIGVNRIGSDPCYRYSGHSAVIDPQGEIVADAGESAGVVKATLDLAALRQYRNGLRFLDDLREV